MSHHVRHAYREKVSNASGIEFASDIAPLETGQEAMEQGAGDISHLGGGDWPVVKESRKQQTQEVGGDLRSRVRWSPKLQVLDEGTSTLDPKTEKTVNDNLRFSRRFRRFRNAIGKPWSVRSVL